jgi:hypothetical protein
MFLQVIAALQLDMSNEGENMTRRLEVGKKKAKQSKFSQENVKAEGLTEAINRLAAATYRRKDEIALFPLGTRVSGTS